ncbi:MAG: Asp23/Gls24 family envelope stress response protein [Clostridia bacterium]|nr:Asp23/Gls24 family envelope stress response protein [Clostridia bacterium]
MAEELNINTEELEELGEVKISEDVISVVAGLAVSEVDGVEVANSITDGIVEKFVKKNYSKGIRVEMNENEVSVDVHVVVEYGIKIPDVAWELQETVKKNIETMTNLSVLGVNIFVEGISIERDPKPDVKEAKRAAKEEKKAAKAAAKAAEEKAEELAEEICAEDAAEKTEGNE